jgi:hypothetical protein
MILSATEARNAISREIFSSVGGVCDKLGVAVNGIYCTGLPKFLHLNFKPPSLLTPLHSGTDYPLVWYFTTMSSMFWHWNLISEEYHEIFRVTQT